jgi:hypothetical protein
VKGLVDILLECCRCICESKGHGQGFKEAIVGVYGCLTDIFISYSNKALGILNVNFGDVFCFGQPGQCFSNQWQRILVLYDSLIEFSVVNTGS